MHALRRCCDMQTCAKYAQPTSVTELELRRCSAFYAGTTPHASSQSCQRSLAAAAKSVDEYDAIEQHRRCSRRGEAGCRTRDQKVRCVALTRPREGRRGAREFWTAITRIVTTAAQRRDRRVRVSDSGWRSMVTSDALYAIWPWIWHKQNRPPLWA